MSVLDVTVALKWVLPEADTPKAVRLRTEFLRGVCPLIAPDVFPFEVGHALAKAERRGIIPSDAGERRLIAILRAAPVQLPSLPLLRRAFRIASAARIGVWECL
jgi:predicted nucleic acid-binding protein